ncbi:MAG: xanthine phosphoribosyltransferase [Clostridia bacterium]|nr:xanthine phosphoribosyltransferase [Clostridia bacterium]
MQMLKEAILQKGRAINQDVLLVDSFLNHQVDVRLMREVGETFARRFQEGAFTRVVTIESSGIAPAAFTALALGLPLVVMKKQTSKIMTGDLLETTVRSFTKGTQYQLTVKREFLGEGDRVLLIDDFLASGEAAFGVLNLASQAGATVGGIGIVIEKAFQPGRKRLEDAGMDVYSLARVKSMTKDHIEFVDD